MDCYYCKRKIYEGEKTATVQLQIKEWIGEVHTICRNCAEDLGVIIADKTKPDKEVQNASNE